MAANQTEITKIMNDEKQNARYALRHKRTKLFVIDETPEYFPIDIFGWSDDVGEATDVTEENDWDMSDIINHLCAEDVDLKPSDIELVEVRTIVEPIKGEYSVIEIEPPEWFVATIEDLEKPSGVPTYDPTE